MKRLIEKIVFCGLVTAWRLATVPTRRSPDWAKATTDGVVREPSEFAMTVGSPPSRTATTELVVPRSIPTARAMEGLSLRCDGVVPCPGSRVIRLRLVVRLAPGRLNFPAHHNGSP